MPSYNSLLVTAIQLKALYIVWYISCRRDGIGLHPTKELSWQRYIFSKIYRRTSFQDPISLALLLLRSPSVPYILIIDCKKI